MRTFSYRALVYLGAVALIIPTVLYAVWLAMWIYIDGPARELERVFDENRDKTALERWEARKGLFASAVAVTAIRYFYDVRRVWGRCINLFF